MESQRWPRWILLAAALYNLLWGMWVVLRPLDLFRWSGAPDPLYPEIWQCVGMIVGVYGIGYAIAAKNPFVHWPIVLVGLLGKIFGPIGFLWSHWSLQAAPSLLPWSWGVVLIFNDLIWWWPLAAILYLAFRQANLPHSDHGVLSLSDAHRLATTQRGQSLLELQDQQPVLLIFLRHSGCTFCRQALADLARQRQSLRAQGVLPVVVHMGREEDAADFFASFGLADIDRISDPQCVLYRAYTIPRGGLWEMLAPRVWWHGFQAAILKRHGIGKLRGDGFQLSGTFLVHRNRILAGHPHQSPADRTDYCQLSTAGLEIRTAAP